MAAGRLGRPGGRSALAGPAGVSAALHVALAALLFLAGRGEKPVALPPVYRVDIVAAPPGPRAQGVVSPTPPPPSPEPPAPTPPRAERPAPPAPTTKAAPVPARTPPRAATPTTTPAAPTSKAPPQQAGGGPTGGRGTDVATVRTQGIEFPYPGYLNNIVRQIALRFKPDNPDAPLSAEVFFLLRRDGSISDFRFLKRSGVYAFDLEAQGAVEAAAAARSFGPLPGGFPDDVLPVIFSFDPRLLR